MTTSTEPEVVTLARQMRAKLISLDAATASEMIAAYGKVWLRVKAEVDGLLLEAAHNKLTAEKVQRLGQMRKVTRMISDELDHFAGIAGTRITEAQAQAVNLARENTRRMIDAALPPGIDTALLEGTAVQWTALHREAFSMFVGMAGDGGPLARLLDAIGTNVAAGVREAIASGIAQGWSPRFTAIAVRQKVGMGLTRALTISRTECLPGDTLVDGAVIEAIYRRWYEGTLVEIITKRGRNLSATPNHPMLTNRGWVPAGQIALGDNLICHAREQYSRPARNSDIDQGPSTLREIFDSFSTIGVFERRRGGKPDFHGDGMQGYVDVLRPLRPLSIGHFAPLYKPTIDRFLSPADKSRAPICQSCKRLLSIDKQACFCIGADGRSSLLEPSAYSPPGYAQVMGYGYLRLASQIAPCNSANIDVTAKTPIAPSDSAGLPAIFNTRAGTIGLAEHLANRPSVSVKERSDLAHRETGSIELDDVIFVHLRSWSGHVYNLSTPYGYFSASQVYTGNTLRAYREANRLQYAANSHLVKGFRRVSARDDRVCMACAVLDGEVYETSELGYYHIACRCGMSPITVTYKELGIPVEEPPDKTTTTQDWFLNQDEATQRTMLGNSKYEAWRGGKFELSDIPKRVHSDVWGDSFVEKSLEELLR